MNLLRKGFCFFLLLFPGLLSAQWQVINSGITAKLEDVCFTSDSVGFIIAEDGTVLRTYDQGSTWNICATLPGTYTSICNVGDTLFVGGNNIYRSDDGGNNWNNIINLSFIITDLQFFNSREGLYIQPDSYSCTSSSGTVTIVDYKTCRTNDSGASWQVVFGNLKPENRFQLLNDSTACITGNYNDIIFHCSGPSHNFGQKTTDRGNTWHNIPVPGVYYSLFYFLDDTLGYFMGSTGSVDMIWRMNGTSINSGYHIRVPAKQFLFINEIDGYSLNEEKNIYRSTTEGVVWDSDYSASDTLNNLYNDFNQQLFAVGSNGIILRKGIIESQYPDSVYRSETDLDSLSFDSVMVGANKTLPLKIQNLGNMDLQVNVNSSSIFMVSLPNPNYSTSISFLLSAQHDTIINVKFIPADSINYHDTIIISATNQPDLLINVFGTGINNLTGEINDVYFLCDDTINVVGDVTVLSDGKLIICPGTTVLFHGNYKFDVYGTLIANATLNNPIIFIPADTIVGWNGIQFYDSTVIDTSILNNCIIRFGRKTVWPLVYGGGISFASRSNVIVDSCTISDNYSEYYGGGIGCYANSSPIIRHCKIFNNEAKEGGGILFSQSSPTIINNEIYNNRTNSWDGGGISCLTNYNNAPANIIQNLIFNNTSFRYGGGIDCDRSSPNIFNNTICNNFASIGGGGVSCKGGNAPSNAYILNNIIYGNMNDQVFVNTTMFPISEPVFENCDIENGFAGTGNISQHPSIVAMTTNAGVDLQLTTYDWSLMPNSPCINAGSTISNSLIPPNDFVGNPRIYQNTRIDIGAFEFQGIFNDIKKANSEYMVMVYPNPAKNELFIRVPGLSETMHITITDIQDRIIYSELINSPVASIELAAYAKGIYFLKINNKKGFHFNKKIIFY